MAIDWAAISQAVLDFHATNGWWPSQAEYDALVASLAAPKPATPAPVSATLGAGPDSLVLKISQDAWQGSAQYTVSVDGVQIGGVQTASALRSSGQSDTITVRGDWAAGPHKVTVTFLNDAWGGSAATDRNLHIDSATYNGKALPGAAADLGSTGPFNFGFTDGAAGGGPRTTTAGAGSDTLVLKISQDAWQGDAQYVVRVDGNQVGGTFTAGAAKSLGQVDTLTLKGNWLAGQHRVEVDFLNDAHGGAGADRNLYVEGATYNGQAIAGSKLTMWSGGPQSFGFDEMPARQAEFADQASFADEFSGTAVDPRKWPIIYGGGVYGNGAFQWDRSEVSVSGGALHIGMEKQANGMWGVGGLATNPTQWQPGFGFQYGKVEIMAKVSQELWGTGPVFLLWPASNDHWPPEVDILETPKGKGMFTNHWAGPNGEDHYAPTVFDLDYSQWHVYGLEWTPDRLTMTVDGRVMHTITDFVPQEPMSIGLQGHVGAAHEEWYGGSPNGSGVNYVEIAVDYVRVYDYIG